MIAPSSGQAGPQAPVVGVLIVDDQAPFRSAARGLIGLIRGWRVLAEAASGEDGVALALTRRPNVVLMDINLPGMSGIEATRRIMAADPDVEVVLLSTYAADDLPQGALDCGATAYVRKEDLSPRLLRSLLRAQPR